MSDIDLFGAMPFSIIFSVSFKVIVDPSILFVLYVNFIAKFLVFFSFAELGVLFLSII